MQEMLFILLNISLPIILLIMAGFVFQKIFHIDVRTMTRMMVYLFSPVMIFYKVYNMDITISLLLTTVPFVLLLMAISYAASFAVSGALRYKKGMKHALGNAFMLPNVGNYGIPLIDLVFPGNALVMASQLLIVVVQNVILNTFGVFILSTGSNVSVKQALLRVAKMPVIYSVLLLVIIKPLHIIMPKMILVPMGYISNAFIAFALLTLGVQLADVKWGIRIKDVIISSIAKMTIPSLIAFGLVLLMHIDPMVGAALVIGVSTPAAVQSAVYAREFGNEPEFASQLVLGSTVLCTFTLPLVIFLVRGYFAA